MPGSIHGIGVDLVRLDRFERFARDHEEKLGDLFRPRERKTFRTPRRLAEAWALKEASLKALGGLTGWDVDWTEMEVGRAGVRLTGAVAAHAKRLGVQRLLVSTSRAPGAVVATVVATR